MASRYNLPVTSRYGRVVKPTERVRELLKDTAAKAMKDLSVKLDQQELDVRTFIQQGETCDVVNSGYSSWIALCDEYIAAEAEYTRFLDPEEVRVHRIIVQRKQQVLDSFCADVEGYLRYTRRSVSSLHERNSQLEEAIQQVEKRIRDTSDSMAAASLNSNPTPKHAGGDSDGRGTGRGYVAVDPDDMVTWDASGGGGRSSSAPPGAGVPPTSTPQCGAPLMPTPSSSTVLAAGRTPSSDGDTTAVLAKLADMLDTRRERLPRMEPEVFDGDPIQYPLWVNAFDTLIERNTSSPTDRLFYLGKYTSKDARESIAGYLSMYTEEAYDRARAVLRSRYGDRVKVAEAYRRRLAAWKVVKKGDGRALQKLADFLWQCHAAIATVRNLSSLNTAEEMNKLCRIVPTYIAEKWARVVDRWYYGEMADDDYYPLADAGEYPPFVEFCRLISREARIATGPTQVPSTDSSPAAPKPQERGGGGRFAKKSTSLAITSGKGETPEQAPTPARQGGAPMKPFCHFCKGEHWIVDCLDFLRKPAEEKRSFALYNSLCFGCLRKSHSYRQCRMKQPELLQEYDAAKLSTPAGAKAHVHRVKAEPDVEAGMYYSMIVPVYVQHARDPDVRVKTYALLDTQSDSCFLSEKLLSELGAPSVDVDLQLNTIGESRRVRSRTVSCLTVEGHRGSKVVKLPRCYSRANIPVDRAQIPRPDVVKKWEHLRRVADQLLEYDGDLEVGLLLGYNCPAALMPLASVQAGDELPYAVYTALGWSVMGRLEETEVKREATCHRTAARVLSMSDIGRAFDLDFIEPKDPETLMSQDDRTFMEKARGSIVYRKDGHFEMDLPFAKDDVTLPNNRHLALKRLLSLRQRMKRDTEFAAQYKKFIGGLIEAGHAERAPETHEVGKVNFMPHHGVRHPRKPGEIRGVFDAAAELNGVSLNSVLLHGPDLTNNLTGVLCRFRQERVAFMCDVKGMFLQVGVAERHRDFLRFLWFEDGDPEKSVIEYRMCVHSFGATSSPSCANFALRETADRFESVYSHEVAEFLRRYFYVDDGLKSTATDDEAVKLFMGGHQICKQGGFFLHKFTCNRQEVIDQIPRELLAKNVQECQSLGSELPTETSLGLVWEMESDCFVFLVKAAVEKYTRRGLLSALSSVYDPLGLLAPVLLVGRLILQKLCLMSLAWDADVPEEYRGRWEKWHAELKELSRLKIPRCLREHTVGKIVEVRLHHFSDASQSGYGACSYAHLIDGSGAMDIRLLTAKARVAPKRPVTMPRMELQAAVLATKMAVFLNKELDYPAMTNWHWSDSKVVLGYIANSSRKFHIYVSNRVHFIRENSRVDGWRYVKSADNPADLASRGCASVELISSSLWWSGPDYLRDVDLSTPERCPDVDEDDPEVKKEKAFVHATVTEGDGVLQALSRFSSWHRLLRCVGLWRRYFLKLLDRVREPRDGRPLGHEVPFPPLSVAELGDAERVVIALVQKEAYPVEYHLLKRLRRYPFTPSEVRERKAILKRNSNLYRLDVFLGDDDVIHVGGRIRRADLPVELKHPRLLPQQHHVTELIIRHRHSLLQHPGRQGTLSGLRSAGFWVVHGRQAVDRYTKSCVICKRLRGRTMTQKMSDLPAERVDEAPPFTHSGVDFCGPFLIKEGRSLKKRWICAFTCFASRAAHYEVAHSLTTSSFLNAFRRFVARRGPVRSLKCDRGTNFVGAANEMEAAKREMDDDVIQQELLKVRCDWVVVDFNTPKSSHMGGVWERVVRMARSTLMLTLSQYGEQLSEEMLQTFVAEAEAITNSRPITCVDHTDPWSDPPLTPATLLTTKTETLYPPPGKFVDADLYSQRYWRRVQYIAQQFWRRWRHDFLPTLQPRGKWQKREREAAVDDVVILVDEDLPRMSWPLARVEELLPSKDGLVRKVRLKLAGRFLERPVHKLIILSRKD